VEKTRVILDTNFLLLPGQSKIDIFEGIKKLMSKPYELCIYEQTIDELNKLASNNKKDKPNAKVALSFIKQKNLKTLHISSSKDDYLDSIIAANATKTDIVCTQDRELKRMLKKKNVKVITLRSHNIIEV